MYRRCLITVFLTICIFGCNAPVPEETTQDPNVTPEGVRITPDVVYGHKFGMALTFDMYQPENQNGAGVIFINSGGWHSPQLPSYYKETVEGFRLTTVQERTQKQPEFQGRPRIKPLLDKGFTVFVVRHGDIDKFKLPEIVSDIRRAVRFIHFQADKYGIDTERLGVWGNSAGGHLSLLIGTTSEIGNSEATEVFEKGTGRVAAVVAFFPPTDLKSGVDYARKNDPEILKEFPFLDLSDELLIDLSPIFHVSADDPPTLILHGDKDNRVPIMKSESMYQALQEAGVESKFVIIPGAGHGFFGKDADHVLSEVVSWFEKYLVEK
jgi:dienelactone hydrolase